MTNGESNNKQERSAIKRFLEYGIYLYRRNNWMLDLRRHWNDFNQVSINKPVFLLGTEGGGLTLISRIIRRHKDFVSVSGNYNYWSGADEMQLVLGPILPSDFTGIKHDLPSELKRNDVSGNCLYAIDKFLPYYRRKAEDVTPKLKRKFRKVISWMIARHGIDERARFIDKSQVFTVKVSFLNEILKDTDPKFILVTRNPYVISFNFARTNIGNYTRKTGGTYEDALRMGAQHWKNSMECALEDGREVENFTSLSFEKFLKRPEQKIKEICDFIEIDFDKNLLPQPEHKIPFGSKGKNKWYPLRPDVNQKYFDKMNQNDVETIDEVVGKYARKFNYEKPQVE